MTSSFYILCLMTIPNWLHRTLSRSHREPVQTSWVQRRLFSSSSKAKSRPFGSAKSAVPHCISRRTRWTADEGFLAEGNPILTFTPPVFYLCSHLHLLLAQTLSCSLNQKTTCYAILRHWKIFEKKCDLTIAQIHIHNSTLIRSKVGFFTERISE